MREEKNRISINLAYPSLLTTVFVVLKLCEVIDWSWWWVLTPLWVSIVLVILGVLLYAFIKSLS